MDKKEHKDLNRISKYIRLAANRAASARLRAELLHIESLPVSIEIILIISNL